MTYMFVYAGSLEMEDVHNAMPSIPDVLRKLHTNADNNKLSMLSRLIQLEYSRF